jgi:hypothetical protein
MITAALGLNISDFTSNLNEAGSKLKEFSTSSAGGFEKVSIAFGAGAAAAGAAGAVVAGAAMGMWKAMNEGGGLVDLSEQTGLGIEKLMQLKIAFEQAGLSADDLQPVINKLQKAIVGAASGTGPAAAALQELGLSVQELGAMDAEAQLSAVGDAISKIENPTQKAAVAMELFGKSGGKMLALFASGGLDAAAETLGQQGKIMAENAGIFDKITDTLGTAAIKLQGFFVGMASAIAPELLRAVDEFNKIDLSHIGVQIGEMVAVVLNAFSTGSLGELVALSMEYGFYQSLNLLAAGIEKAIAGAVAILWEGFKLLISPTYWGGWAVALFGVAQQFGAVLTNAASGLVTMLGEMLAKIPMVGGVLKSAADATANKLDEVALGFVQRGEENVAIGDKMRGSRWGETKSNISGAVAMAGDTGMNLIDLEEERNQAGNITSRLLDQTRAVAKAARDANPAGKTGMPDGGFEGLTTSQAKIPQIAMASLALSGGAAGGAGYGSGSQVVDAQRQTNTLLSDIRGYMAQMAGANNATNAASEYGYVLA